MSREGRDRQEGVEKGGIDRKEQEREG